MPRPSRKYVNAYLESERAIVALWRDDQGKLQQDRVAAEWVAYAPKEQFSPELLRATRAMSNVQGVKEDRGHVRVSFRGRYARRLYCFEETRTDRATEEVRVNPFLRLGVTWQEADVHPIRRWLSDTGAQVGRPRRCYLDIEGDSRASFGDAIAGRARVLCWTVFDDEGSCETDILQVDDDQDEARVLLHLWEVLRAYDQVCSWSGETYDFPVVKNRSLMLGLKVDARRWCWCDFLAVYKRQNMHSAASGAEKRSFKLEAIAQAELGEGKHEFDSSQTWEEWAAGGERRARLHRYNIQDTALLPKLERKKGYLDLFATICEVCRLFGETASLQPTRQLDGFLLRLGEERGHRFPSKDYDDQEEPDDPFAGAFVMQPRARGIVRGVHVADFASLYPSIILTWNMSPDTKAPIAKEGPVAEGHCRSPSTGIGFTTSRHGVLADALREMLRLRKVWNDTKAGLPPGTAQWQEADNRSTAYKVAANSFYGVVGSRYSRYYDQEVAESVTQNGVWLIKLTIRAAEARGWSVMYGDTDSIFVTGPTREEFGEFVAWCNRDLYPGAVARQGCVENHVKLAYEKEFARLVIPTAKRYCNPPEAPIWMADCTFKDLGDVRVGEYVMGWKPSTGTKQRNRLCPSQVVAVHRHRAPIVKVTMESGRVFRCTADHLWLRERHIGSRRGDRKYSYEFVSPKVGRKIVRVIDRPAVLSPVRAEVAAWLGGIWDGEGSLCSDNRGQIVISQSPVVNPEVCERIERSLALLGFSFSVGKRRHDDRCATYRVHGGIQERLNFMAWCKPAKRGRFVPSFYRSYFRKPDRIVSVEPDGFGEVVGMTTVTGNYVAWGYASKNCATYKHYKGKDATADSKPEIKGLEYKRGDAAILAFNLQAEVIDMLVGGLGKASCPVPTDRLEDYHRVVARARDHVLNEPLPLEEIRVSKSISKSLKGYEATRATKTDGTQSALPSHVQVAKVLAERGVVLQEGGRVEYVVKDGSASPAVVIPASDYDGTNVDRFHVWEKLVFPPTLRLLEAAFPEHDWAPWAEVRPRRAREGKKAPKEQGALFQAAAAPARAVFGKVPAVPASAPANDAPYVCKVTEDRVKNGLGEVRAVVGKHPGTRPLVLVVRTRDGNEVTLDTPLRVDGSQALHAALLPFRPPTL